MVISNSRYNNAVRSLFSFVLLCLLYFTVLMHPQEPDWFISAVLSWKIALGRFPQIISEI